MKKIILLVLMSFMWLPGFSQVFNENFDTTTALPDPTTGIWTLSSGEWLVRDNRQNLPFNWEFNPQALYPANSGNQAAYIQRENTTVGELAEEWLITPQLIVEANRQLRFFTRQTLTGDLGTRYQVRVSANADPSNLAAYTVLVDYTETTLSTLTPSQLDYEEKILNLTATGARYFAFVKVFTPTATIPSGDRWIVDDVRIVERCQDPTTLGVRDISTTSTTLTWFSTATSFDVEYGPSGFTPGTGVVVLGLPNNAVGNQPNFYNIPPGSLLPSTAYQFYVTAHCTSGINSPQTGPFNWTTAALGSTCAGPIVIGNPLPYSDTNNTLQFGNNIVNNTPGTTGCGTTANYLASNDVVYSYTVPATTTGLLSIQMNPLGASNTGVFVYSSCATIGSTCLAGVGNTNSSIRNIPALNVVPNQTIYIVISSSSDTASFPYTLIVQNVNCVAPTALGLVGAPTTTTANIKWNNGTGSVSTSWEVVVQNAGSGIPQGSGTTVTGTANTSYSAGLALTPTPGALTPDTNYEFWVRADCGNGTFSIWSGPFEFSTLPTCPKPTALTAGPITQNSVEVNWANPSTATSFSYYNVPCGGAAPTASTVGTDFPAGTATQGIIAGLNPDTCYDIYIRANCGPGDVSTWTGPLSVTTQIVPPACGGTFSDPGGSSGDYGNNLDYTVTITPSVPGEKVTVTFTTFNTEATYDGLFIYDGNSVLSPQISSDNPAGQTGAPGSFWGTGSPGTITATSATGALTFRFVTDGSGVRAGWTANVTCGPPPACQQPTAFQIVSPLTSNTAVLSWTNPGIATAFQVIAVVCGDIVPPVTTPPTGGWVASSSATGHTFSNLLPDTCYNFYVVADCTTEGVSTVVGPKTGTTQIAPPVCGGLFTDTGGSNGEYENGEDYTVTISPSVPGQVVTVTFTSFDTEPTWDGLFVYDGNSVLAPQLSSANPAGNVGAPGSYWGTANPGSFTSSSAEGSLTFRFKSDGSGTRAGWSATVTCGLPPTCPRPTQLTATIPTSTSVVLNWFNNSTATIFEGIALPCGSPPPTAATVGYPVTANVPFTNGGTLISATCYDFYVRAICDGNDISQWSNAASLSTLVAPPVCGGNFVDQGGLSANYPNDSNSTVTIFPTNPGDIVTVTFTSFNTESNYDGLYVYDGSSVNAPQIASENPAGNVPGGLPGSFWGTEIPGPFTSSSSDGSLTFIFISDGIVNNPGWVANITCNPPPSCLRPNLITAGSLTPYSAAITWNQPTNPDGSIATAWEILVLPYQSPIPAETTNGLPTGSTYNANNLQPGTAYTVFVRAVCSADSNSLWSTAFNFATPPLNDECATATFAPVNQDLSCVQFVAGTLIGATQSALPNTCGATANDDAWFYFTASATAHIISFNNTSADVALNYAIYEGDCTTPTQVYCSLDNSDTVTGLTINTTYRIRVFSVSAAPQFNVNFNLCIGTVPCATATPFCTGQVLTYPNATGITPGLGQIGCLFTSPNPAFFFLQVNQAGPLNYLMTQSTTPGGAPDLDVDYAMWGPYTDNASACAVIPNDAPLSCSYSFLPTENFSIPNAQLCEIYVVMITNFSDDPGFITFTQTNTTGGGTTQCYPFNTFNYSANSYCQNSPNPSPILVGGAVLGTFSATPAGMVIDPATGIIDLTASLPGNYLVTSTTIPTTDGVCPSIPNITTTRSVTITAIPNATISYASAQYCKSENADQIVTVAGSGNGSYSSTAGLFISGGTGAINPSLSNPGVYTVTYTVAAAGGCDAYSTTTQVTILDSPEVPYINNVTSCNSYILPVLTVGNYFTETQGGGTPMFAGDVIDSSMTLYVYVTNEICSDEQSFTITITSGTSLDPIANVESCLSYVLPPLTIGAYYSSAGGVDPITDLTITESQTVYVYLASSDLICGGEVSFTVTILQPQAPTFAPIPSLCLNSIAPALPTQSLEGYTGTWSPSTIDTTVEGDFTFTFTPDVVTGACLTTATLVVTIDSEIVPVFDPIPNVCQFSTAPILPTSSTNGVSGTWAPAAVDTSVTGTFSFTFTPDSTQSCAVPATLTVTVDPQITPTFNPIAPVCVGGMITIPTTSNEGITGTFNPSTTSTTTPGIFPIVFTPDAGQGCTIPVTINATVLAVPVVTVSDVFACGSYILPALPVGNYFSSPNGVDPVAVGTEISVTSLIYVYAQSGTCTDEASFTVSIGNVPFVSELSDVVVCEEYTLPILIPTIGSEAYFTQPNGAGDLLVAGTVLTTSQTVYIYATTGSGSTACSSESSFTVTVSTPSEFNIQGECEGTEFVLSVMEGSSIADGASYQWFDPNGNPIAGATESSVTVSIAGTYSLVVTIDGCSATQTFGANSISCMIQRGISPRGTSGGDGKNDYFDLAGLNVSRLEIFNRYGTKVYSRTNYSREWYGQSDKGEELADGTYFYVIERSGVDSVTGWIYINREK